MALKIKFSRRGAKNSPLFRIVVAEGRSRRDGAPVAVLGQYNPGAEPDKKVKIDVEKLKYWVSVGAKPTHKVASVIKNIVKLNKENPARTSSPGR